MDEALRKVGFVSEDEMKKPDKPPVVRDAKVLEINEGRGALILTRTGSSTVMFEHHEKNPYKIHFFELHPSEARALGEALMEVGKELEKEGGGT